MKEICVNVAVIGSGCAGYNAADCLYDLDVKDIALFTEGICMGTSRNTGSDKQTYYKLGLSGEPDSIGELAKTLYNGQGVHGDTALCEAANSARCFIKLTELGVPFPRNEYGEFPGYKTDHDPRERASSIGPLTSKIMVEKLEQSVNNKNIAVYDHSYVYKLLVKNNRVYGACAVIDGEATVIYAKYVILATGGPAGVYKHSVYPESQTGATGLAIDAGAELTNFAEWQYGLASTRFRWNVSGTYQQVLPRYVSVDREGNETEFLPEYFDGPVEALNKVFLKGYQWPFDVIKSDGSSAIDWIVYNETVCKGKKVYLDFTKEPQGLDFSKLSAEAREYLKKSDALIALPIQRLARMNPKAIEIYAAHGIDLHKDYLEIAVCAQHHNGGISVDKDWQTTVENLYAAGECAGTFGVYRPGGAALNATQVGSLRAAESVALKEKLEDSYAAEKFAPKDPFSAAVYGKSTVFAEREFYQTEMSRVCAHIRNPDAMKKLLERLREKERTFYRDNVIESRGELVELLRNKDILTTCTALLENAIFTASYGSRGSCAVICEDVQKATRARSYKPYDGGLDGQCVVWKNGSVKALRVRPLPVSDNWFENVWREFNQKWKI